MEIITYPTIMKMFKKLTEGKRLTSNELKNLEDYVRFKKAGVEIRHENCCEDCHYKHQLFIAETVLRLAKE